MRERVHLRALVAANVGNAVEFYDWMAYTLLVPYFGSQFFPNSDPAAVLLQSFAIFAVGSLARPLGAFVLGRYTDRHGRRNGMVLSVSLMVAASIGMALIPSYAVIGVFAPLLLVVARLVQGFALGPEFGGSATYIIESAPERRRGLFGSTYQSSVALGTLTVSVLISALEIFLTHDQMQAYGWRIVFAIGGVVAVAGLLLRRRMPETDPAPEEERLQRTPLATLWRNHRAAFLRICLITASGLTVMYGMSTLLVSFGPTFTHIPVEQSTFIGTFGYLVMLLASPLFGLLSDRVGRVWTLRLFAIAGTAACVPPLRCSMANPARRSSRRSLPCCSSAPGRQVRSPPSPRCCRRPSEPPASRRRTAWRPLSSGGSRRRSARVWPPAWGSRPRGRSSLPPVTSAGWPRSGCAKRPSPRCGRRNPRRGAPNGRLVRAE